MNDSMRICIITFYFSPLIGGAETQSERQARQHQELGHDVTVVTLRAYKQLKQKETLDGLPVVRVGGIYKRGGQLRVGRLAILPASIALFFTLWRTRHQFDVIHVFQVSPLAAAAALIGKLTRKPVIVSLQSTGPGEAQSKQPGFGTTLMADTLDPLNNTNFLNLPVWDRLITSDISDLPRSVVGGNIMLSFLRNANIPYHVNSTRSRSCLTAHGFRGEQIFRVPHGVDTERFRPAPEQRPDPGKAERVITCVARLAYAKGVDVLLHAWARMLHAPTEWRQNLNLRLRLAGDGNIRPQLEQIAAALGIEDSVEFLGMQADVVNLLQSSWGFVQPSRWESLPNALLEAMSCGLPCVATRVSGSEDVIVDGVNGLLVEPEDPVELAHALRRMIEDTDLAQRMGQEGRATVVREYRLSYVSEQFQELYRSLINQDKLTGRPPVIARHQV